MKIEYLTDGAPECPLVRFYGPYEAGFSRLIGIATTLGEGSAASFDLADDPVFTLVNIRELVLGNGDAGGLREISEDRFAWSLPPEDWETVALLLQPLAEAPADDECWQWLDEGLAAPSTKIAVLASHSRDGGW